MLAGNANRIADGEAPLEPTAPRGSEMFAQPMAFARIHQYLSMATPLLWTRQPDTIGVLGLALNACAERDGHAEERERIRELARPRLATSGGRCRRSRTRASSASSPARRFGWCTWRTSWR